MEKVLTGQMIHTARNEIAPYTVREWESFSSEEQFEYNHVAEMLNQQLGLNESIRRPATGQMIYEVEKQVRVGYRFGSWEYIWSGLQYEYNEIANMLNQQLGLCESSGDRPANDGTI